MKCVAPGGILKFWTLTLNLVFPEGITTKGRYCPSFEFWLFPQEIFRVLNVWFGLMFIFKLPVNIPPFWLKSLNSILVTIDPCEKLPKEKNKLTIVRVFLIIPLM